MTLLTRDEFIRARDQIARASMLQRLADLRPECQRLEREYRGFRRLLLATENRNEKDGIEYELYDKERGIAWRWAAVDAEIGDIENDNRYIEWMKAQKGAA